MKKSAAIVAGIIFLLIAAAAIYWYSKPESQPQTIKGNETLEILVINQNNLPMQNIEVDLWRAEKPSGPPSAGISTTNEKGIASFKIISGEYLVGFNQINFPKEFAYPDKISVGVNIGMNNKTIKIGSQSEQTNEENVPVWTEKGIVVPGTYADADVVDLGNGNYRIYYSLEPEVEGFNGQVYSAVSSDGISWVQESGTRKEGATFPSVIKLSDGKYRMYFQNSGVIKSATSSDGLAWKDEAGTRMDAKNNVGLTFINVLAPTVINIGSEYVMAYAGAINEKYSGETVPNSETHVLMWATSKDGLTFEKKGMAVDSRNSQFKGWLDGPEFVNFDGETRIYFWSYKGVYHAVFSNNAFSDSEFDFTNSPDSKNPFPLNPPGDPTLMKINGKWLMYYGQHQTGIYYAAFE
ncbi:hypothetical protein HY449_03145 [Candidatus Pacearchaeota archaeon]|nr:hypothetical protein [Candidatus Pacearchaeota archaeon]